MCIRDRPCTAVPDHIGEDGRRGQSHAGHTVERGLRRPGRRFPLLRDIQRRSRQRRCGYPDRPRTSPRNNCLLGRLQEAACLLEAAPTTRYKAALGFAYGAGLRVSDVAHLKVDDIDSQRMLLRVENGKGGRDRPGVGLISATALAASATDPGRFRSGRQFAPSGPAAINGCIKRPDTRLRPTNAPDRQFAACNAGAIRTEPSFSLTSNRARAILCSARSCLSAAARSERRS